MTLSNVAARATTPARPDEPTGPNDGPTLDSVVADVQARAAAPDLPEPPRPIDADINREPAGAAGADAPDAVAGSSAAQAASPPVPGRPNPEPDRPAQDPSLPHDDEPSETEPDAEAPRLRGAA